MYMSDMRYSVENLLLEKSKEVNKNRMNIPMSEIFFFPDKELKDPEAVECNKKICDLANTPHFFVLACLMDRQMNSAKAFKIPYIISQEYGESIDELCNHSLEDYIAKFNNLHRFEKVMAECFYNAVHLIKDKYDGDASRIWTGRPSSALVVLRFLEFQGCGSKIATMAANILQRDLKVEYSDYCSIDISTDVHVMRVLRRLGLLSKNASPDEARYLARSINPEYPGIIDYPCWEWGQKYCRPASPKCKECPMESVCPKVGT